MNENMMYCNNRAVNSIKKRHKDFQINVSKSQVFENSLIYFLLQRNVERILVKEHWVDKLINLKDFSSEPTTNEFSLLIYYTNLEFKVKADEFIKHEVLSEFIGVEVFRSDDLRRIAIVMPYNSDTQTILAKSALMIPLIFEKLFKEYPIKDIEKEFLMSIRNKDGDVYSSELKKMFKSIIYEEDLVCIKEFESSFKDDIIEENDSYIRSATIEIENLYRRIADQNEMLIRKSIENDALINSSNESGAKLVEFFSKSPNLEIINAEKKAITYRVHTTLGSFDPENAKILMKKQESCLYVDRYTSDLRSTRDEKPYCELSIEDMRKFYEAVFAKETYKIQIISTFKISSRGFEAPRSWMYGKDERKDNILNWHIQRYSCYVGSEGIINEAIRRRDYVGVVIQSMAVAANINLAEPNTTTAFCRDIFSDLNKKMIIDTKTGELVSVNEVITKINKETEEVEANG